MSDVQSKVSMTAANSGLKKGLPYQSLKDAEEKAAKVWEIARRGTAQPGSIAEALGLKGPKGGGWSRNITLLRAFGLIDVSEGGISLTDLGIAVVQDADPVKRQEARRSAFFKVRAYRDLADAYDNEELPAIATIASRLRYDYGRKEDIANQAAREFVESLQHAGLLDGTVVQASPTDAQGYPGEGAQAGGNESAPVHPDDFDEEEVEDALDAAWDEDEDDAEMRVATWPGEADPRVTLSITLDLSRYRSDEVIEILTALRLAQR